MMTATIDHALERVRPLWAPPPELTVSEFADREITVATGPLAGTRWQTDLAPYQRGIMDAVHEPGVEFVVIMGSSQWGKTAIGVNTCCYYIAHDPCSILVVLPTVEPMAKDFAKNRLDPTIKASPTLNACVDKKRQKDASNTTLQKTFRGGFLAIAGANSASSLASRPVRLLWCDEIDRYPPELPGEGATLSIAIKRTTTFRSRRRVFLVSSPTIVDGPIHAWFQRGDQRRFYVPCPACGTMHAYEWQHVHWTDHDPATAHLACPSCRHQIDEAQRVAILKDGEWRAEHPERADRSIVSFHVWEGYSPFSSLKEIVRGFLRAREAQKAGDRAEMHTWQNTTLGEPVELDEGDGADPNTLLIRRAAYPVADMPARVCCLTMGVDVQDDRLEALVVGWMPGEECALVHRDLLPGDTSQPAPWVELDLLLDRSFTHPSGQKLPIYATCIDSAGHRTTMVYDWALKKAARRVYAIIGRDGERPIISSPSPRRWGREQRQVPLYTIGVDAAKSLIVSRLKLTKEAGHEQPFPGYVHIPATDWADEELIAQITAERLVKTFHKGQPKMVWRKSRARNEMLDCFVMALAAVRLLNPNYEQLTDRVHGTAPAKPKPSAPARPHWLGPRRGSSWLRGDR